MILVDKGKHIIRLRCCKIKYISMLCQLVVILKYNEYQVLLSCIVRSKTCYSTMIQDDEK